MNTMLLHTVLVLMMQLSDAVIHSYAHRALIGYNLTVGIEAVTARPWYTYDPDTKTWGGFVPETLDIIAEETGMNLTVVPLRDGRTFDTFFRGLQEGAYDSQIYSSEMDYFFQPKFGLTLSQVFYQAYTTGVVRTTKDEKGIFAFVDPFKTDLWLATIGVVVLCSVMLLIFDHLATHPSTYGSETLNKEAPSKMLKSLSDVGGAFYHSWAMLLGGEDYQFLTWPSRVFRIAMLFFIVILTSTYTANLASFFTKSGVVLHGPASMSDLKQSVGCIKMPDYTGAFASVVGNLKTPPASWSVDYDYAARTQYCPDLLKIGEADIWLDSDVEQQNYVLNHCDDFTIVAAIKMIPSSVGLAYRSTNTTLMMRGHIDAAISWMVRQSPRYKSLLESEFGLGKVCNVKEVSDTEAIHLEEMVGVFIVLGALTCVALGAAVAERAFLPHMSPSGDNANATQEDILRALYKHNEELKAQNEAIQQQQDDIKMLLTTRSVHRGEPGLDKLMSFDEHTANLPEEQSAGVTLGSLNPKVTEVSPALIRFCEY